MQSPETIARLYFFVKLEMTAIEVWVAEISESAVMKTLNDVRVQAYGGNQRYGRAQYEFNSFSHSSNILLGSGNNRVAGIQ